MREVKVGQIWLWASADKNMSFEILKVSESTDNVEYQYSSNGITFSAPLTYFDTGVLVKDVEEPVEEDSVNHPSHYNSDKSGVECIEITRHRNFNIGAAIKYLWRAGLKEDSSLDNLEKEIQDLEKAIFHIKDEIKRKRGA